MDSLVLRDDRIIETVTKLESRIADRFPESGLSRLCGQLAEVARQASQRSTWIAKPIRWIRVASTALTIALVTFLSGSIVYALQSDEGASAETADATDSPDLIELIQAVEAGLNDIIFVGIAIFFLFSLETRIKRRRALAAIHELRSMAHVIDMHQLTKDPERVLRNWADAKHSPKQSMTALELNRYLDYCSEMLSLIGKIAALYVQQFDDADAVAAVSEVEQLSTGLSRKIWQKIMILQQSRDVTEMSGSAQQTNSTKRDESVAANDSAGDSQ